MEEKNKTLNREERYAVTDAYAVFVVRLTSLQRTIITIITIVIAFTINFWKVYVIVNVIAATPAMQLIVKVQTFARID